MLASSFRKPSQLKFISSTIYFPLCYKSIQPPVLPICSRFRHPLGFKGHAQRHGVPAPGQIAVIVALAHAHPAAGRIKGGAGHQHQIKRLRPDERRPFQNRRADAVSPNLPAVRPRHGGGQGKVFPTARIGHRFAQPGRLLCQPSKIHLPAKSGVEQQILCLLEAGHGQNAGTDGCIGRRPLCLRQTPAGQDARPALRCFPVPDLH